MAEIIKKVLLLFNPKKDIPLEALKKVSDKLSSRGCEIYAFSNVRQKLEDAGAQSRIYFGEDGVVPEGIDFAVVFGGDGSMIRSAALLSGKEIPVVGINFGRVGYLAELEADDISFIDRIVDGDYEIDSRMMLDIRIMRSGETITCSSPVLNDAVLSNGPVASLLTFDVMCNGTKLRTYRADGVIVATPTGSTAYSMSAGGPILDPAVDALCVTPICPHALGVRPVVLNGDSVIELRNIKSRKNSVFLTPDGRGAMELFPEDRVVISRSDKTTRLIRFKKDGFLGILKNKLSEAEMF